MELGDVSGAFQGVHVYYERTGSKLFTPRPRVLIYPALFVTRKDGALFTVIHNDTPVELDYRRNNEDFEMLAPHLDEVRVYGASLVAACAMELGGDLILAELSAFPGFRSDLLSKAPVDALPEADEWLVATGSATHFLLAEPRVQ